MPGLVKIGFSSKDPRCRAKELNGTGAPHPYEVEFDLLVENPRIVERKVHEKLAKRNEGKEWFQCEVHEAVKEIESIAIEFPPTSTSTRTSATPTSSTDNDSASSGNTTICESYGCQKPATSKFNARDYCVEHRQEQVTIYRMKRKAKWLESTGKTKLGDEI